MPGSLPMNPPAHTFSEVPALIQSRQNRFKSGLFPEYKVLEGLDCWLEQLTLRIKLEVIEISYLRAQNISQIQYTNLCNTTLLRSTHIKQLPFQLNLISKITSQYFIPCFFCSPFCKIKREEINRENHIYKGTSFLGFKLYNYFHIL